VRNAILTIVALLTLTACEPDAPAPEFAEAFCDHMESCFTPEDGFEWATCYHYQTAPADECYWERRALHECTLEERTCVLGQYGGPCDAELEAADACAEQR
jgi:hypothetical protein